MMARELRTQNKLSILSAFSYRALRHINVRTKPVRSGLAGTVSVPVCQRYGRYITPAGRLRREEYAGGVSSGISSQLYVRRATIAGDTSRGSGRFAPARRSARQLEIFRGSGPPFARWCQNFVILYRTDPFFSSIPWQMDATFVVRVSSRSLFLRNNTSLSSLGCMYLRDVSRDPADINAFCIPRMYIVCLAFFCLFFFSARYFLFLVVPLYTIFIIFYICLHKRDERELKNLHENFGKFYNRQRMQFRNVLHNCFGGI